MSAKAPSSVLVTYREQQGRADDPPVAMLLVVRQDAPRRPGPLLLGPGG
eukprot:CAMPEP_0172213804 /NCGR_PEP_ID=MMETSP1050-20130122/37799_1 /TAXON_ID=233186 /ORGANISM="Cryptomonas curvata, Strain CCAP979/52" /LENGTH=48 /DNA_ID= /DNA_START= /DNA_END= /DNA_ORIENTATION=